jgi:hypothetical protein
LLLPVDIMLKQCKIVPIILFGEFNENDRVSIG